MGMKKVISLILALSMTASLIGCGENKEAAVATLDKEHVYSYQDIEFPVKLDNINGIFAGKERVYVLGTSFGEETQFQLCSAKLDGSDALSVGIKTGFEMPKTEEDAQGEAAETPTPRTEEVFTENVSTWINNVTMDEQGNLTGVTEVYRDTQDESGNFISESNTYLMQWNGQGELKWSIDIREGRPEEDYFYVNSMLADKEGNIWLFGPNEICVYDTQGTMTTQKKLSEDIQGSVYMDRNGEIFLSGWTQDYSRQFLKKFDKDTMELGEEEEFPTAMAGFTIMPGGSTYDFILTDSNAIYGYNLGDAEPLKIMDAIDSDLDSGGFQQVGLIDETHFVASYNDPATWQTKVSLFTKVPADQVKDKTVITLAGMYINNYVKTRIVEFNKTNPTYRIQVKEYRAYSTAEDYMAGYTQMNNDIITGKMPDILLADSSMPIDSYIAKGLLTDFYPLIENDPELNREDYLENIFDAFSVDGKMYRMVTGFSVSSVIGKTSIVGDRTGWNMDEFEELMASLPEGTQSFSNMTRESMIYMGMMMTKNEYIDSESGKCSFDSQGFIDFLEFVNQFPAYDGQGIELGGSISTGEIDWQAQETMYREDKTILMNRYLSNYNDFNRAEKGEFGEDATIIGFPTEAKIGNAIMPDLTFALSSKSKCQEGAWEFLRYYLTDEYQNQVKYQFPIKKSALEIKEQEAMDRPYWVDEKGEKQFYDDYVSVGGVDVKLDPMTQEEAQEFTDFLTSLTLVGEFDQNLNEIIEEEAAPFFEGQKSAEEVAKIIQSRMQIYISESR